MMIFILIYANEKQNQIDINQIKTNVLNKHDELLEKMNDKKKKN